MEQLLRTFITVVERQNFTKAAKQLHMTQPAVSQAIKNLEDRLGTVLIERDNKEFYVNQAGRIVYESGKEVHNTLMKMETIIRELKNEPAGTVTIGASYTIGEYIMPRLLINLHKHYPSIHAHIIIGNTQEIGTKLINREIDLGFIEGTYIHPSVQTVRFMQENMYLCSNDNTNLQQKVTTKLLEEATWLIRESGSGTRDKLLQFLDEQGIEPRQSITLGSTQLLKEAIKAGLGISLMSETVIEKELATGDIQQVNFDYIPIKRDFTFIKYKTQFETKINQIVEKMIETL